MALGTAIFTTLGGLLVGALMLVSNYHPPRWVTLIWIALAVLYAWLLTLAEHRRNSEHAPGTRR